MKSHYFLIDKEEGSAKVTDVEDIRKQRALLGRQKILSSEKMTTDPLSKEETVLDLPPPLQSLETTNWLKCT